MIKTVISFLCIIVLSACTALPTLPNTYENEEYGVELHYPADWRIRASKFSPASLVEVERAEGDRSPTGCQIIVKKFSAGEKPTSEQKKLLLSLMPTLLSKGVQQTAKSISGTPTVLKEESLMVNSKSFKYIVIKMPLGLTLPISEEKRIPVDMNVLSHWYLTIDDNKIAAVHCTVAEALVTPETERTFRTIANSFRVVD